MLTANILSMKMPLSEALAVSLIGITVVMVILAIIACLILLVSKAIRAIEAKAASAGPAAPAPSQVTPAAQKTTAGQVELIDTDEKSAAVIMAIVSKKSGIPLERLSFRSIKLIEDEKKGDDSK